MLQRGQVEERSFPGIDYSEKVYFGFESEKENGRNSSKASIIKNLPSSDPASVGHDFGPKKTRIYRPIFQFGLFGKHRKFNGSFISSVEIVRSRR